MSTTAVVSKEVCTGCEKCVSTCPRRAISIHKKMEKGNNPFAKTYRGGIAVLHLAVVDAKKCNGCKKCEDTCHWDAISTTKVTRCPNCNRLIHSSDKSCRCGKQLGQSKDGGCHFSPSDTKTKPTHSESHRHGSKPKKDIDHTAAHKGTHTQQEVAWTKDDMEGFFRPVPTEAKNHCHPSKSSGHGSKASNTTCPSCNSALRPGAKFCTKCGKAVISHQQPR